MQVVWNDLGSSMLLLLRRLLARLEGSSPMVVNWRGKLQSYIYLSVVPRVGFETTTSGIDHCSAYWNMGSEGRKAVGVLKTSCPNCGEGRLLSHSRTMVNHVRFKSLQINASHRTFVCSGKFKVLTGKRWVWPDIWLSSSVEIKKKLYFLLKKTNWKVGIRRI